MKQETFALICFSFLHKVIRVRKHIEKKNFSKKDCTQDLRNLEPLIAELNHDPQRLAKFIQCWRKEIKNILPGDGCKCHIKLAAEFTNLLFTAEKLFPL
jgi:hypothetical protein